ncbi:MAG: polysaccharide deacetylase family protein [Thermoguttaceae bacterium]
MRAAGRLGAVMNALFGSCAGDRVGILTYHRIALHVPGLLPLLHNVEPARFRRQLEGLLDRGFTVWPLRRIIECGAAAEMPPRGTIAVTFDDGYAAVYRYAWPVLQELQIPATIFLTTGYLDQSEPFPFDAWGVQVQGLAPPDTYRPLTSAECREMQECGLVELAAHTHTHQDFRGRPEVLRQDLQMCEAVLSEQFGVDQPMFAFPFGSPFLGFTEASLVAAVRETGVTCALNAGCELDDPRSDPFDWGRIHVFPWDTGSTLAAKLGGWYSWAPRLYQRLASPLLRQPAEPSGAAPTIGESHKGPVAEADSCRPAKPPIMSLGASLGLGEAPDDVQPATAQPGETLRDSLWQGALALADQAAVSGMRFFATLLVGRMCGPEELGIYSLGFSFLLLFSCAQETLIFVPLAVYGNQLRGTALREYSGGVLGVAGILALVAAACLAIAAGVLQAGIGPPGLAPLLGTLALAGPVILSWEFCRWFSLAHRRFDKALVLDLAVAVTLAGIVLGLVATGSLSAVTAYVGIAAACAINAGLWWRRSRTLFAFHGRQVLPALARNWSLARWMFATQVIAALISPVILWVLAALGDAEAVGQLAACTTVILLYNPFLLGISNLLIPKSVQACVAGGRAGVRSAVWKNALVFTAAMAVFGLLVILFGDRLIGALFGKAFAANRLTFVLLALTPVATACSLAFNGGLCALERTDGNFAAALVMLATSIGAAVALIPLWGVSGAACGLLAGTVAGAAVRGAVFQAASTLRPVP